MSVMGKADDLYLEQQHNHHYHQHQKNTFTISSNIQLHIRISTCLGIDMPVLIRLQNREVWWAQKGLGKRKFFHDGCNWLRGMSAVNESIEVNTEKKDPHPLRQTPTPLPLTHYKASLSEKPKQNVDKNVTVQPYISYFKCPPPSPFSFFHSFFSYFH